MSLVDAVISQVFQAVDEDVSYKVESHLEGKVPDCLRAGDNIMHVEVIEAAWWPASATGGVDGGRYNVRLKDDELENIATLAVFVLNDPEEYIWLEIKQGDDDPVFIDHAAYCEMLLHELKEADRAEGDTP